MIENLPPKVFLPTTRVMLRDGRIGTVRASHSSVKFCKRNNLDMDVYFDEAPKERIRAKEIDTFIEHHES